MCSDKSVCVQNNNKLDASSALLLDELWTIFKKSLFSLFWRQPYDPSLSKRKLPQTSKS